jgi:transposase
MSVYTTFIGIDIGKFEVVAGTHGHKLTQTFTNTEEGFKDFFTAYEPLLKDAFVVLETTGGYEKLFLKSLIRKGVAVHRANTRQVKAFIHSLGHKGKTDALDALGLARYGYERHDRLALYKLVENGFQEVLQEIAQRRLDLNQLLVAEKNREQAPTASAFIKNSCNAVIELIQGQLVQVMEEMEKVIKETPELAETREILKTIPGVGDISATMLVALLPELGHVNRRQIASLTGLAPYPNESGTRVGYRCTRGGRQDVRKVLFMAGMAAAHSKSKLGVSYKKMVEKGKKKMVALVAIMRRIVVIANTKIKEYLEKKEAPMREDTLTKAA